MKNKENFSFYGIAIAIFIVSLVVITGCGNPINEKSEQVETAKSRSTTTFSTTYGPSTNRAYAYGQSFTPNVGASIPDAEMAQNVPLTSFTLRTADTTIEGFYNGDVYLNIYSGYTSNTNPGTFVGSSSNTLNMYNAGLNTLVEWNFDNLLLDKSTEYAVVFSTTNTSGSIVESRLKLDGANNYSGGQMLDNASWDAEFTADFGTTTTTTNELYSTSFEDFATGTISSYTDGLATWNNLGGANITTSYANTGSKCLHIPGGTEDTLEIVLTGDLQQTKGITFFAERWTSENPFEVTLKVKSGGVWTDAYELDSVIRVGARFLSEIRLALDSYSSIEAIRLVVTSPVNKGLLVDDLTLLNEVPTNLTKIPVIPTEPLTLTSKTQLFNVGTYRIPAIITANNGDLIVAIDARYTSSSDLIHNRNIDIAYKRSTDNGLTWSDESYTHVFGSNGAGSDPSFVIDRNTGDIICFYNYMVENTNNDDFRFYYQKSTDNGVTWQPYVDFTDDVAPTEWQSDFKFITSGRGIQLEDGSLLHNYVKLGLGSVLIKSTDGGNTWFRQGTIAGPADENKQVELNDGTIMTNARDQSKGGGRYVHTSSDDGDTWVTEYDESLIDPACNAGIIKYTSTNDGYNKNRMLYVGAADPSSRKNLAVRISYDEGQTWSDGKVIESGASAYSEITILADGSIGVVYEDDTSSRVIQFVRFTLEQLTDGQDSLSKPYVLK